MKPRILPLCALAATPLPALADDAWVEANTIGIFYHELGHAVIDVEGVPIFGQEEDAADVFSIFLIDALFEEETAIDLAYDASFGFWGEVEAREDAREGVAWWDEHGPDEQRFYNTVCIFYGANPDSRDDFASDMGLPEERAEYCDFEYEQANASWGAVLDDMIDRGPGDSLQLVEAPVGLIADVLRAEIEALNGLLTLAEPVDVYVESCGEANAWYDPEAREITFCTEFEPHLRELLTLLE